MSDWLPYKGDWLLRALGYPEEITMEDGELCYTPRYEARSVATTIKQLREAQSGAVWRVWDRRHDKPVETMSIIPMTRQQAVDLAQRLNRAWEETNR